MQAEAGRMEPALMSALTRSGHTATRTGSGTGDVYEKCLHSKEHSTYVIDGNGEVVHPWEVKGK
jgi:hypothetical protein